MLYSVRSERMLVEQLEYNLLFQWFVGLSLSEHAWDATSFTKNRERLLSGEVAQSFFVLGPVVKPHCVRVIEGHDENGPFRQRRPAFTHIRTR